MLENLKNKLRNIFKRSAAPKPVLPPEILDNKYVRKEIVKHHRKKVFRRLRNVFLLAASLSGVLQYTPDLVSTKFDTFMSERGYPADLSKNYSTGDIRVYDRHNPLYPFHLAGREVGMIWHENLKEQHAGLIPLAIVTPWMYTKALYGGFIGMVKDNELDAYSMAPNDPVATRTNFIRPPGEFSLNGFLEGFSGVNGEKLEFKSDRDDLRKVLFEFVMLHEARHGDQEKLAFPTANEADADVYAFKVMAARGVDPKLLNEAATIVLHARTIHATIGGDLTHATTLTLAHGGGRIFDAYEGAADFERLGDLLSEADHRNDAAFDAKMPVGNRYFYLTLAMNQAGLLNEDPGLKTAASAYISALNYFNAASGGKLIDPSFNLGKINLGYLTQEYKPVPDKLHVPPAAPKPVS